MPFPQVSRVVDVVVVAGVSVVLVVLAAGSLVVVVDGAMVDVVVGPSHVHVGEQIAPGGQRNAPFGDDGSHGSSPSTMPFPHVSSVVDVVVVTGVSVVLVVLAAGSLVVVVDGAMVDVVVGPSHVHVGEQIAPGGQRNAP